MSVPNKLGISFTAAEVTTMTTAVQTVIDTIVNKIIVNLSEEERKSLSKVGPERLPYIERSIGNYATTFPQFNPLAYSVTDATNDASTYSSMDQVLTLLTEATERAVELQMVAGHFVFLFMRKQYGIAESNLGENVPGAQTVYDGLKGAFEGQGPQGGAPANP